MTDRRETELLSKLRRVTESPAGRLGERLQSLWSGYGAIYRFFPEREELPPQIVKFVTPPSDRRHPRGWAGDRGHARKLQSYQVELAWYRGACVRCDAGCRIASPHYLEETEDGWLFVLEDLDAAGFPIRRHTLGKEEMRACLKWLAHFHALHAGLAPDGLWDVGTYWHLATRPDELQIMKQKRLREAASAIDAELNQSRFQTWVHGDAKVANFCFSERGEVAVVDFQYVGAGVGVKDVAYFLSSCLDEGECLRQADDWVEEYFGFLRASLTSHRPDVDAASLEEEWRRLYPFAWADFMRFLVGWAPDHYKIHGYSQKQTEAVLSELGF